jgi:glycosyltransferase involved in cell wall biosynthesis
VGGPAIQAITLTRRLQERGYRTTLVRGVEGPREGSMDFLARQLDVTPLLVKSLTRDPGPRAPLALLGVAAVMRRERPALVHTHAAMGGTIGRAAALLARPGRRRPVIVHTFHGHSLTGYFSSRRARVFLAIERWLAARTDCLVAVSEEVRDELVAMGVAPRERFEVVRLGFDLSPFAVGEPYRSARGTALRRSLGIPSGARVVTLIARLVPIKRVDRFLRVCAELASDESVHFLVVGDGELADELRASPAAIGLGSRLTWAGMRRDIPDVCFASDVVVLTSDNEGTPVSLIEAQAAGVPVVSTAVGGVASVVADGETGFVVEVRDEPALGREMAGAVRRILSDGRLAAGMRAAGPARAAGFSLDELVGALDGLYRRLTGGRMG